MWTYFSGVVGGGVYGRVFGTVHTIITGVGVIIAVFQFSTLMCTQAGESATETIIGMGTVGTTNEFLTNGFTRTGMAGTMIDIGKGTELGASRIIILDRTTKGRN